MYANMHLRACAYMTVFDYSTDLYTPFRYEFLHVLYMYACCMYVLVYIDITHAHAQYCHICIYMHTLAHTTCTRDQIRENPPYGIRARFA